MANHRWKIHKLGGSSLADANCFRRVAGIVLDYDDVSLLPRPGEIDVAILVEVNGYHDA